MGTTVKNGLTESQRSYFEAALALAEQALSDQEVPVGCVLVYNDVVIGRGKNEVNKSKNATRHAEFVAFDEAAKWCSERSLDYRQVMSELSVYVSLEPCIMCASALYQLKVRRIFFGASNPRFGGIHSVASNAKYGYKHEIELHSDIDQARSVALLRKFYERENPFVPEEKRKLKD